ncbi:MAG: hypothetical protein K0S23_1811 [Fluviicola sp.]|jgi:hypothetical protein|uniref:hypothetical protein n=1 Tax=Fluviicola sp. TaxID=1917219 RepID=UPI002620E5FF|nr:hypothetical protein [Fluviicola sp.]MDF3027504.1 hypothetical protein [Fluviicola sp.]
MKAWSTCLLFAMVACSSPETDAVETVSFETVDEIRTEDSIESSARVQEASPFILPNEVLVLSFKTKKNKQLFICRDRDNKYLVYRFGSKPKVELQYPVKPDSSSFKKFDYSAYFRPGGLENLGMSLDYLSFINKGYRYLIYKTYIAEAVGNENEIGIRIIHLKTGKETMIEGDFDTLEGGFSAETMELVNQSEELYE